MNIENELKLIPGKGIRREQIVEILRTLGIQVPEKGKIIHQEDTYFDDKEGTLEKSGGSFRIRRKQGKTQVTYKIPIKSNTEYKQRKEYEIVVPKEYEQNLDMYLAIKLLKGQYPELVFPENMEEILTVINDRNKIDIICPDGTVLEMAFDTLKGKDAQGILYTIPSEIELETISGNPENLTDVYDEILKKFPGQIKQNVLSKYARTKNVIRDKKLNLEDVAACAILSEILNSEEFSKLQYKGQILHKYDKPTLTNLDNFKNVDYLVEKITKIKSGEYKPPIPKELAQKSEVIELLNGEEYEEKDEIDLEDMVCILLSDINYGVTAEVLADFLNKKYYSPDCATTNRLSHSQQVMLISGLIAKSSLVGASFEERFSSMITGLSHDIGHVPMAHNLEAILKKIDGIFSHEVNGKRTLDRIYHNSEEKMLKIMENYFPGNKLGEMQDVLEDKATQIKSGIANHSRKGAEHREKGIVLQAARLSDKMYAFSDTRDLELATKENILDDSWINNMVLKISGDNQQLAEIFKQRLEQEYFQYMRKGDFGRAVVNAANTVHHHKVGEVTKYNVDQDIWTFMEKLIDRVKQIRKDSKIDEKKGNMTASAELYINEWLYKEWLRNGGNAELTWDNLLTHITCVGEKEVFEYIKGLKSDSEKIDSDIAENNAPLPKEDIDKFIQYMKYKKRNEHKKNGMTTEQADAEVAKIEQYLQQITSDDILKSFSRDFVRRLPDMRVVDAIKTEIHDMADVQLKIQPTFENGLNSIYNQLEIKDDTTSVRQELKDEYYSGRYNGRVNSGLKIRVRNNGKTKTLAVKVSEQKNVSERIEKCYTYELAPDEQNLTVEQMLQKLKEQHPGLDIELEGCKPINVLGIIRNVYPRMYKGYEVQFKDDFVTGENGKTFREIEVTCPEHPPIVSDIKKELKKAKKYIFVKDSKIDRVSSEPDAR